MTDLNKFTLYLYDLPKESFTSVAILDLIKEVAQVDIPDMPQIKRDPNKPFYTAMIRVNDAEKFKKLSQVMKYFNFKGKPCRALPYMKEVTAAQRNTVNKNNNLFIKGIPANMDSKSLDDKFKEVLGGDFVVSAKVSINSDYSSRGYGFVCLSQPEFAQKALELGQEAFGFEVHPYVPKDRRELRKSFNNIYVKNFPKNWTEEHLRQVFSKYGNIKSLALLKGIVPGTDEESPFAFVCFEDPTNKEYGPKCAADAVTQEHDKEYDGVKLYVKEALPKQLREQEKRKEQIRYKNSKKRCNLYVKNFPPNTTEEQLRSYFEKYGEIESIKLNHKEGQAVYAFVCYKSPESASFAKQQSSSTTLNGQHLFLNFYELKEIRQIQQEQARDVADYQNYRKQAPQAIDINMLNRPEIFQVLQYLMMTLNKQQQMQNNNRRGLRQNNRPPHQQDQRQMSQQPPQQQRPLMAQPLPPQQVQPQPIPQSAPAPQVYQQMMNLPPHVLAYNQQGTQIRHLINPNNPNLKNQIGEFIYEHVEKMAGEDLAPKITGMLIDLPLPEMVAYVSDYLILEKKVREANTLLRSQAQ